MHITKIGNKFIIADEDNKMYVTISKNSDGTVFTQSYDGQNFTGTITDSIVTHDLGYLARACLLDVAARTLLKFYTAMLMASQIYKDSEQHLSGDSGDFDDVLER
jgi:hypothetical protein